MRAGTVTAASAACCAPRRVSDVIGLRHNRALFASRFPLLPSAAIAKPPLRVLIAHNRYQLRGGEDAVVEAEADLLRAHGHAVALYERHNDELAGVSTGRAALESIWSIRTMNDLDGMIDRFRPDVLHVHNTLSRISPSVLHAATRRALPTVMTLHNFRLLCPQGLLLRNGRPCEDCVGHLPWRSVVHGCYRGSRPQTAVLAAGALLHQWAGTWRHRVDRYIALNAFCRDRFIAGGLPEDRLRIKPNFVDLPPPPMQPRHGLLFVGRLSEEKGVAVLAQTLRQQALAEPMRLVGEGPLAPLLEGLPGAEALGPQPAERVYHHMAAARALVLPSICYESFPRTLVEAYACGLPVIASRLGAMAALVRHGETGLLFNPGDAGDLAQTLAWALAHPDELARMGSEARCHYNAELTGTSNYRQLMQIYQEALACHAAR